MLHTKKSLFLKRWNIQICYHNIFVIFQLPFSNTNFNISAFISAVSLYSKQLVTEVKISVAHLLLI